MTSQGTVFCKRYKKEMASLGEAPLAGPIGNLILANSSEEAWKGWIDVQIKIINEERLDLSEEQVQKRLFQEMISFLGLQDDIEI